MFIRNAFFESYSRRARVDRGLSIDRSAHPHGQAHGGIGLAYTNRKLLTQRRHKNSS